MSLSISSSYAELRAVVESTSNDTLPSPEAIKNATASLHKSLPSEGLGEEATQAHLLHDITPGFNGQKTSSNYYGFVTGGVYPIAEVADNIVTAFDQNVGVHLPDQSISTIVEDQALSMLVELLDLGTGWNGKTFTTGATASNILGLACAREAVVNSRLQTQGENYGVGEMGLLAACLKAGIHEIQVLTTMGHSSLYKAAAVVGIGRASVRDVALSQDEPWKINMDLLESELKRSGEGIVSIVALSAGEVNTGCFATTGADQMKRIRTLCDQCGAWLHVDGAFGIFARSLPRTSEFNTLQNLAAGLEVADSITGDGHKMLNVPYDCGFFFTRKASQLSSIFQNPNAAYLATDPSSIPSPLNIGLENSRRFRALPVYAVLLAYGKNGVAEMFARQVRLARRVSKFIGDSDGYQLLPGDTAAEGYAGTHIIVLFRARNEKVNSELVQKINATRKMYVSGTRWKGAPACRIAISTWRVDVERDLSLISGVLSEILGE